MINTLVGNSHMGLISKNPLDLIDNVMVKHSKVEKLIASTKVIIYINIIYYINLLIDFITE
jgi:hypothetical protein